MTADEIYEFFLKTGLHITDGTSPCAGEDYQAMREAAQELAKRINAGSRPQSCIEEFIDGQLVARTPWPE